MMGGERVLVAMSGGVDSSVAAAILRMRGFEVIGATMQIWPRPAPASAGPSAGDAHGSDGHGDDGEGACCSIDATEAARRVASILGIPYYVLDLREEFEREVIARFAREYILGRTPNPCIACNQRVKFGHLLHKATELGARYVATGHYARIRRDPRTGRHLLFRGRDGRKDQSYVLYTMTQREMSRALFPVGDLTKDRTRKFAAELGLPVATRPESQEICFVPGGDYRGFLKTYAPESCRPGPILDTSGRVLGAHEGIAFYTVGQRKGLGLASARPLYVVDLDHETNTVVVGDARDLLATGLVASDVNWIAFDRLEAPVRAGIRIRYNAPTVPGVVAPVRDGTDGVDVTFDEPQRAVTPGQSCVFYDGDVVLGGGIIQERKREPRPFWGGTWTY